MFLMLGTPWNFDLSKDGVGKKNVPNLSMCFVNGGLGTLKFDAEIIWLFVPVAMRARSGV